VALFHYQLTRDLDGAGAGHATVAEAQTMAVTTVVFFQIFYVLGCRSLRDSAIRVGLFSNPWIYAGIGALLLLQAAFVYAPPLQATFGTVPLEPWELLLSCLAGLVIQPILMLDKWLFARRRTVRQMRMRGAR
jgi:magnesium-transporting ATPase (P-type)